MKEILFKALTKEGKWVEGYYVKDILKRGWADNPEIFELHYIYYNQEDYPHYLVKQSIIPESICQYAGLKDKNGNKIFEGDIVKYDNGAYQQVWTETYIEYGNERGYPAFDLAEHDFDSNGLSWINENGYEIEIIGNIHAEATDDK